MNRTFSSLMELLGKIGRSKFLSRRCHEKDVRLSLGTPQKLCTKSKGETQVDQPSRLKLMFNSLQLLIGLDRFDPILILGVQKQKEILFVGK